MTIGVIYPLELIDVADEYGHDLSGLWNEVVLVSLGEIVIETHSVLESRKSVVVGVFEEGLGLQCNAANESCKRKLLWIDFRIKALVAVLVDELQCSDEVTVDIGDREDQYGFGGISGL